MRTSTRCNRGVPRGRTRCASGIKFFLMLFLLFSFFNPSKTFAQINIDGNSSEWFGYPSAHVQDPFGNGVVDDQFTEGSKDFLLASEWIWSISQTKAKNDIANGAAVIVNSILVHGVAYNGVGPYLAFAGDRTSNNGDAQIGFWFFQDGTAPVTVNNINNFAPPKHDGDLLVLADFTGGGNDAAVTVLSWVSDGSGTYPNSNGHFNLVSTGAAVAENNGGTTAIPTGWQFLAGATSYGTNEFYEGFVDLGTFGRGAACFSRFQLETRSSQSITASLDDFVGGPLGGVPSVTVNSPSRCSTGDAVTITATPTPAGTYTYTWTVPAGATDPGNVASFSATVAGQYCVTVTNTNGCTSDPGCGTLTVNSTPAPTAHNLTSCESGTSGAASFNLNSAIDNASGGTITFYTTQADATAGTNAIATPSSYSVNNGTVTIYVRSTNGTCFGTTSFTVTVTDNPDVTAHGLTVCENGSTGQGTFDLNSAIDNADGGTISFYTSLANAQTGTSPIATPGSYTAATGTTIYVRSANGSCFGTTSFTLTVTDNPDVTVHNLSSCETGTTEHATFNLNGAVDNADGGTISFYTSLANAQTGTSPIATPGSYSAPLGVTTIYVRSANGSCFGTTSFTVTVTDNPDVVVQNLSSCETGTTGHATFNLNSGVTNLDGGTATFYASQSDANAATNAIASPTTFSAPIGTTTIWVRDANGTCATVTSFTITVAHNPTANAGDDATQCRNSVAGTNTFGTNTFNLSGSGTAGTCSWSVVSNTQGYTITWGGTGQNSCAPSVSLSGAAVNGGSVTLRLSVTGDCGTATDDVTLTLTPLPLIRTLSSNNFCPGGTGSVSLPNSEAGVSYQLFKDASPVQAPQNGTGGTLTWTGLDAGNYSVEGTRIGTSCSTTSGPAPVQENSAPDPSVRNLTSCENGSTGGASFNLNDAVTSADGGSITFYSSSTDAQNATNAISASQSVTVAASPKTFWVRSQNATTGCFGVASFTITVTDNPDVVVQNLSSCETGTTGHATFNLNSGVTNLDGGTATFYASQSDANAATNAIASPTTFSAPIGTTTIWVRDANGTCATVASFTITVTDNPDVVVQNLSSCETGTTGHATFNLNSGVTNLDGGTATFYASQSDANAATNAIASPTTFSAPIGTTTIWVRDANGTCATVTSFTITVHGNPTPTADNKEVCVGATVDLTGTPAGGTWSGDHVTGSTFDATGVAAGNYTVTYTVTDEFGCTGSTTATVTVKACGGPLCTYTQGYYGNTNGNSCDADGNGGDAVTYQNPVALITAELLNGGTLTVGISGRSVYLPVPDAATTAARVNSVMPGNTTPRELSVAGDVDINSGTFSSNYLNKQGRINNVLLSQTITLGLNMRISSGLPDLALQAGEFATAALDGPCGTTTTKPQCTYSSVYPYSLISDSYVYKTITADVITALNTKGYPLTVTGLFMLANDALGNADNTTGTEGGASLSAINAAVDAINTGFDKCRVFVGWNVAHCPATDPNAPVTTTTLRTRNDATQISGDDKLSVAAYPNPFTDVVKFSIQSKVSGKAQLVIYNMLGQKINTIYDGYVQANKNISVEYKASAVAQQGLIYILAINGEKVTGKLMNAKQ